ncbi:MAG: hypothetical protein ACYTEQ_08820, partial [Planctomycetota bacterium]
EARSEEQVSVPVSVRLHSVFSFQGAFSPNRGFFRKLLGGLSPGGPFSCNWFSQIGLVTVAGHHSGGQAGEKTPNLSTRRS